MRVAHVIPSVAARDGGPSSSVVSMCRALTAQGVDVTLITTDALQNHADQEHSSLLGRIMTPLMGFKGGVIVAKMWRKYQRVSGAQVSQALSHALERRFANLVTGHGPAVLGGAEELVRSAVASAAAE